MKLIPPTLSIYHVLKLRKVKTIKNLSLHLTFLSIRLSFLSSNANSTADFKNLFEHPVVAGARCEWNVAQMSRFTCFAID